MIEITYLDASKQERTMTFESYTKTLNVLNKPALSVSQTTTLSKN